MVKSMMQPWSVLLPRMVFVVLMAFVMVPVLHVGLADAMPTSRKLDDLKCTTCPNSCGTPCPLPPPAPEYAYPPPPSPEYASPPPPSPPEYSYPPPPEYSYPPPVWSYPPPPYTPRPSSPYCPPPPSAPSAPGCFACGIVPSPPGQLYPQDPNFRPNGASRRGSSGWWLALVVGNGLLVALWI